MGGQSSGYQSQPMNQWGGGQRFGGGGFGGGFGGYGNGGYMPQSFNQQGYGQQQSYQPQGFGWNNNFSNGFGGWNQFGGWPQFNGFQSSWQPQYQLPLGQQPQYALDQLPLGQQPQYALDQLPQGQQPQFGANPAMNQDMVPTRTQGMVRLPPINYDQYQKQPNQYEYLNGGNSPFSQVA